MGSRPHQASAKPPYLGGTQSPLGQLYPKKLLPAALTLLRRGWNVKLCGVGQRFSSALAQCLEQCLAHCRRGQHLLNQGMTILALCGPMAEGTTKHLLSLESEAALVGCTFPSTEGGAGGIMESWACSPGLSILRGRRPGFLAQIGGSRGAPQKPASLALPVSWHLFSPTRHGPRPGEGDWHFYQFILTPPCPGIFADRQMLI